MQLLEPRRQVSQNTNRTDSSTSSCSRLTSLGLPNPMFVHDWTVDDVVKWLGGHGLKHVAEAFRENRITGDVLLDVGREDLAEMGICALGDRMRIVKAIEQLRVDAKQVAGDAAGPSALDFFFLGASPLVTTMGEGATRPLEPIDLEAEQHAIKKALVDANRVCRFQFEFATVRRLTWAVLQRSCTVLFFSGHTLPDGRWLLETETGEALAFDPCELFQHDVASALAQTGPGRSLSDAAGPAAGPAPDLREEGQAELGSRPGAKGVLSSSMCLRLVVLCSCHSCIPASLFIDAGVAHVVAVERSETVLDISARVFVQSLCHSLLVGNTIQNAFKHAQWLVKHNECLNTSGYRATAKKEAQKFVLLPKDANHATVLFPSLARGAAVDCSAARPPVQFPRTRLDLTVVRQVELWRVLDALRHHRFVQVLGPPGVGKKTLVCLVAHYVWQRHVFPDGIHYIHVDDLRWIVALDWSVRRLLPQGAAGDDSDTARAAEAERAAAANWQLYHDTFLDQRFALPGFRLLILDGCHALYQKCRGAFVQWLSRLLTENPGLQVLVTGQSPINEPVISPPCEGSRNFAEDQEPSGSIVEVGGLSEAEAVRLLKWRCHVLPEAAAFLDDHGARLARLCGFLPLALCVCARWLLAQLPRADPNTLLAAMEDDVRRLEVLKPCTLVFATAVSALPPLLRDSLRSLAGLHAAFGAEVAAAVWAVEPSEADLRLHTLREHHLLETAGGSLPAGLPAGLGGVALSEADGSLYSVQPLLRLHLSKEHGVENGAGSRGPLADPETVARLLAGYAGRIASALVRREEFPNVQLVLDLAGATCSFLALLWAVRSIGWIHTWLGDVRRAKLYERALAVLASLSARPADGAPSSPNSPRSPPAPREAWPEPPPEPPTPAAAPERPSDVFLATPPGECPSVARMEECVRGMAQLSEPFQPGRPWEEQKDWIFMQGVDLDPAVVWGEALNDPSQPLLRPLGDFDERALPLISKSHATVNAMVSALSSPDEQQQRICESMLELAAASRTTDPGHSLRLGHCTVVRLCQRHSKGLGGSPSVPDVGSMSNNHRSLLADAAVEFGLGYLSYRGLSGRVLTADLIDLAVSIGQRTDPMRLRHFRTLRLASFHALAFERDPCKAERLLKRCLELKLQKFNTWQHVEIAETLGDCGMLCHVLGDLSHAESMLRTAVGVWRQLLDDTQPKLASAMLDLAGLLAARERWPQAEELYQQAALLLREASDGSLALYRALSRLALFQRQRGKPEVAVPILRECIAGVERALGTGEHPAVAALRHNLALCLMAMHSEGSAKAAATSSEACRLMEQVDAVYKASLPSSSPSALAAQRSLAQAYVLLERPDEAVPLLTKAMYLMEELGSYGPRELSRLHFLLGRARMLQGNTAESRRHFEWVLQHPAEAGAADERERTAAEEFLRQPCADAKTEPTNAEKASPAASGPQEDEAAPEPAAAPDSSEPQGEPESSAEGPWTRDGRHLGFLDVEETSLSVLNRAQYLLGDRIQACLGVLPPLGDAHHGGEVGETGEDGPSPEAEPGTLAALLPRMELVCLRLPR